LRNLEPLCKGYWGERIYSELAYLSELSGADGGKHNDAVLKAAQPLLNSAAELSFVTKESALACEGSLAPLATDAKKLVLHAVGHAHIDMNWM
jgi:hypothetical protein